MRIVQTDSWTESFELTRPYTIAFTTFSSAANCIVCLTAEDGRLGLGAASPCTPVTGETLAQCQEALAPDHLAWLSGADVRELPRLCRENAGRNGAWPAACAAVDMALHDLFAQMLELPLADALGRVHGPMATSVTLGIMDAGEAAAHAAEYVAQGFRILKVKVGGTLEDDIERIRKIRECVGPDTVIRCDANQGYAVDEVPVFFRALEKAGVEFLEQPVPPESFADLRSLPETLRRRIAADESLVSDGDALGLLRPEPACGIFNIKLMKCGGISPALRIAAMAQTAGIELMWGCMDESAVSISAALHTALACPATRYLDLDGSFDLGRDVVSGGFEVVEGAMHSLHAPGLGVRLMAESTATPGHSPASGKADARHSRAHS
jgi:L-Ala-D/L-Glu epimerase